jgi:hypothetical protein
MAYKRGASAIFGLKRSGGLACKPLLLEGWLVLAAAWGQLL